MKSFEYKGRPFINPDPAYLLRQGVPQEAIDIEMLNQAKSIKHGEVKQTFTASVDHLFNQYPDYEVIAFTVLKIEAAAYRLDPATATPTIDAVILDRPEQFEPQADYHYAERQNWATVRDGLAKYRTGDETLADKM